MDDNRGKTPEERSDDPTEGVRIIGAEEAAEAMQRDDIATRRGGDKPRYGDRPTPPPAGPRPALRFPLDASSDPSAIERPAVRRPEPSSVPPAAADEPADEDDYDPYADDALWAEAESEAAPVGSGETPEPVEPVAADAEPDREAPAAAPAPTAAGDVAWDDDWGHDEDRLLVAGPAADEGDEADAVQPGDLPEEPAPAPTSAPVEMPHWTEPATGEVPRVVAGEESDDLDAWSSFASSAPRWRDQESDWSDTGVHDLEFDDELKVGAMDSSRPTDDELYSFDELDDLGPAATYDEYDDPEFAGAQDAGGGTYLDALEEQHEEPRRRGPLDIRARRARGAELSGQAAGGAGGDVMTRVISGVAVAAVFLILLHLGAKFAMVLVVAVVAMASLEFFNAVRKVGYAPATFPGLVACVALPLAVYWKGPEALVYVLPLTVMAGLLWYLFEEPHHPVVEGLGITLLGVCWIGVLGSFGAALLRLPEGRGTLCAVVLATVLYDTGGFAVGRSSGRTPLTATSPNKTVEGLLAGAGIAVVGTAIIAGLVSLGLFFEWGSFGSFKDAALLGVAAAIAAPLGDLSESLVKRDLGVKDMGTVLPGHGGLLDRFDSALFVLPAAYFVLVLFGISPFG